MREETFGGNGNTGKQMILAMLVIAHGYLVLQVRIFSITIKQALGPKSLTQYCMREAKQRTCTDRKWREQNFRLETGLKQVKKFS
jgi:hypothetical protein